MADKVTLGTFLSWQVITLVIAISYIFGHTIKVLSKFQYEFCVKIFDNGLNKFLKRLSTEVSKKAATTNYWIINRVFNSESRNELRGKNEWYSGLLEIIFGIFDSFYKIFQAILVFGAPNNCEKAITEETEKEITKRFNIPVKDWYTTYKMANVVIAQENLKSLSFKFLAKYNFYRSLAFIFLINGIYIIMLYKIFDYLINPLGHVTFYPMLIGSLILWFTFHEKYKRYWSLCGNESVVTLFYFWKTKGKEKSENEKKDTVS